ncbi:hypothetical protein LQ948_07835 [Jiella sp. MQZ9-1]|uniref:Uncharacterized protein n=1 Tax=Jiella flava TaxID=2816857 RepID=A0A939FYS9_9HYPH|nr:hypothetical protein [Jiella flava]MBO0662696.1 hypothetical protein [Jiella flava]MCD2471118.1 hypothetical protein [Jiella flava]
MRARAFVSLLTAATSLVPAVVPALAGGRTVSCYEPVQEPATYTTKQETIVLRPARTVYDIVPARYGWGTREVLVEPGGVKETIIPAEYSFVEKQIELEPARVIQHTTPPVYATVQQKVVVQPATERWEWRVVNGKRVYCRIVVPARYGVAPRRVVVTPGRSWTEVIPARYGMSREKVMIRPASVERYVIAPRYETVREWVMLTPERQVARIVPAEFGTRPVTVKVEEERTGWRQVHLRGSC